MSSSNYSSNVVPIQCCLGDIVINWSSIDFINDLITIKVNYPNESLITLVMKEDIESAYVCKMYNSVDIAQTNGFYMYMALNSGTKLTGDGVDYSVQSIAIKMSMESDFLSVILAFPQQVKPKLMSPAEALNKFQSAEIKVTESKLVPVIKVEEIGHAIGVSDSSLNPYYLNIGNISCHFNDVRMCGDFINFLSVRPQLGPLNPLSQERLIIKIPVTEVSLVTIPSSSRSQVIYLLPTKNLCDKLMGKMKDLLSSDQWYIDSRDSNGKVRFIVIHCNPDPQIFRSFNSLLKSKGRGFQTPQHHRDMFWNVVYIVNEDQNNNVGADVQILSETGSVVKRIKSEPQAELPQ